MISPSPMKSPDRDAAASIARAIETFAALSTIDDFTNSTDQRRRAIDGLRKAASELATLRRRVAEMEAALDKIQHSSLLMEVIAEAGSDDTPSQMAWRSARLIAKRALS